MKVLDQAKKISIPTEKEQEKIKKISESALQLVKEQAAKYPEVIGVELGGSYAKGTWLSGEVDLDIFVKLKKDTDEKRFEVVGKEIGFNSLRKFKPYVRYSEHPYVEAIIDDTRVNVVPCYDVEAGQWKSAADRSSFHTKYILQSLDQSKKDDVRLLKKFLIGIGIYGAEIAKEGFGGYVAEVLVKHYGSFLGVLEVASNFTQHQVIGNPTKKFETPLIIIDPIDSNRNLGTAISAESVGKFILASRKFLKKPSLSFFRAKPRQLNRKNLQNTIIVRFNYKKRSPDIVWGQIKRAANAVSGQLRLAGFEVLRSSAVTDEKSEVALLFLLRSLKIEKHMIKKGPDIFKRKESENYIAKNSKKTQLMWIDESAKILSLQERVHYDARPFLQYLLRKNLSSSGIPRGLVLDIRKGFKVLNGKQAVSKSIKKALSELITTDGLVFGSP
ncbi:MAG TPA: CCA tRNA nucleotidyltransferase [Nitrosopumilaceae archaeon]|nr:CCA tRNA nucleotidyltransferase [Nitrosopumilaceae archaeon]